MKYIGYILILIHVVLLTWSIIGFLEMILPEIPWQPLTNPLFPTWVLILHWSSILFASVSFLYGYFTRWSKTPHIMLAAYTMMMIVCIIETFGYMTSEMKYVAMGGEFLAYVAILFLLFRSNYFVEYFK